MSDLADGVANDTNETCFSLLSGGLLDMIFWSYRPRQHALANYSKLSTESTVDL